MRKYIFKRLIYMVIALFCIITLTFFLMRIAPGNPFASEKALPANIHSTNSMVWATHGISSSRIT